MEQISIQIHLQYTVTLIEALFLYHTFKSIAFIMHAKIDNN